MIAKLRVRATIQPAQSPDDLDAEWRDRVLALVGEIRQGVPQDWTEEELERQIAQAIAEVRAERG